MTTENPKNLYDQVCQNISQITGRGLLYQTIGIIMGEEQLLHREKTNKICDYFGIKPSANKDEDKKIINNLLDGILKNTPINNVIAKAINQGGNMEWIFVAAAFTFVGLFFYKQTLDKKEQEKIKPTIAPGTQEKPTSQLLIPADLCLIVPASIVSNFINSSNLKVEDVKSLIDNASYFLCTTVKVADSNEEYLKTTDETIPPDSRRDVYIRININDGRNMINETMRYYLKDNLPIQAYCKVEKIACLKNPSGLERFNRV